MGFEWEWNWIEVFNLEEPDQRQKGRMRGNYIDKEIRNRVMLGVENIGCSAKQRPDQMLYPFRDEHSIHIHRCCSFVPAGRVHLKNEFFFFCAGLSKVGERERGVCRLIPPGPSARKTLPLKAVIKSRLRDLTSGHALLVFWCLSSHVYTPCIHPAKISFGGTCCWPAGSIRENRWKCTQKR